MDLEAVLEVDQCQHVFNQLTHQRDIDFEKSAPSCSRRPLVLYESCSVVESNVALRVNAVENGQFYGVNGDDVWCYVGVKAY